MPYLIDPPGVTSFAYWLGVGVIDYVGCAPNPELIAGMTLDWHMI